MSAPGIKCRPVFGRVEIRGWTLWVDEHTGIGMSEAVHYDVEGKIVKVVTAQTGAVIRTGGEHRPWWRRWLFKP